MAETNRESFIAMMKKILNESPDYFIDVCADKGAFVTCGSCAYYGTPRCNYVSGDYCTGKERCSKREGFLEWIEH